MTEKCPACGYVGMDNCERADCSWDQWDDGTKVTAKQRADGAAFAHAINEQIAKRDEQERKRRAEIARWIRENWKI